MPPSLHVERKKLKALLDIAQTVCLQKKTYSNFLKIFLFISNVLFGLGKVFSLIDRSKRSLHKLNSCFISHISK